MDKCSTERLLKTTNTKMTAPRSRLLTLILDSTSPVTANDLHEAVSADSHIDLATVYRTLKVFAEKGLVRAVNIDGDTTYYEKSCVHNPLHAHFYCVECGKVECLDPYGFDESAAFLKMAKNKNITSVELVLKGRCSKCA